MDEKRYEELKRRAASLMAILNMGNAMSKIGKQQEALQHYKDAYIKSVDVLEEYGDLGSAYIVYASMSGPLFRYYMDCKMINDAIYICASDMKHLRPLHRQFNVVKPCCLLLSAAQQSTIAMMELLNTPGESDFVKNNQDVLCSVIQQLYYLLYILANNLKEIDPENIALTAPFRLIRTMQDQIGLEPDKNVDSSKIGEIMDFLALNLAKFKI